MQKSDRRRSRAWKRAVPILLFSALLTACVAGSSPDNPADAVLVGVMIDNHQGARDFQRGLEKATLVQEFLVEGFITRFLAYVNVADLPDSIGPVRSVRPYFVDGSSPVLSAILHVGGSPEAIEKLKEEGSPRSFDALRLNRFFDEDEIAPAPHHRFITGDSIVMLADMLEDVSSVTLPLFPIGAFVSDDSAHRIQIDHRSPVHNVGYAYDPGTQSYRKMNQGIERPPSPGNLLLLESPVLEVGELGRLTIDMNGTGSAILFRDGGVQRGTWSKTPDTFYRFADVRGFPFAFRDGQTWMIVLDSLEKVSWK